MSRKGLRTSACTSLADEGSQTEAEGVEGREISLRERAMRESLRARHFLSQLAIGRQIFAT